jgi:alpha-glucoside transport system permease protein
MARATAEPQTTAFRPAPAATAGSGRLRWEHITARLSSLPVHIAVLALVIAWSIPTLALLINSFRSPAEILTTGWWKGLAPPFHFTLTNYQHVLDTSDLGQSFLNSLMITIPATVIPITIGAFAAYAFSWMRFRGRLFFFAVLIGLLAVPLQPTLVPVLKVYNTLGLTGTFIGIWLAHTGYGLPLVIYTLRNFFGSLPSELFESAQIDGASPVTTFFRLVLPLSVPALASMAIFQFLWVWNDLLVALVYLGGAPEVAPMTVTVANLQNSLGGQRYLLTAGAFMTMILPLLVFFSLQRYFVRGLLAGSVKG